jgi:hypothetical protein
MAFEPEDVRRLIIQLASQRQKPGAGSGVQFLHRRTAMTRWPDLKQALGDIGWATVGGVATRHYMPERATVDLDILIAAEDARAVRERLHHAGYQYVQELTVGGSVWRSPDGVEVDVLESNEPWVAQALVEAQQNLDLQGLPILPLPYFVLMKFRSGRVQDLADITRMLGQSEAEQLNEVRRVVGTFEPDALEDLESLITLGRMERGEQGK